MYKILYNIDRTQVSARDFVASTTAISDAVLTLKRESALNAKTDSFSFTNSNLVDNVLTINHGKGTDKILLKWVDPNGAVKSVDYISTITATQIIINFGDVIEEGTHRIDYIYN